MLEIVGSVVVLAGILYLLLTLLLSRSKRPASVGDGAPDQVIFVVPALNEEIVIGHTIGGLLAACGDVGRILVIDDGSTDATADVVRSWDDPRVQLHQRHLPDARRGKGAALNDVYRRLRDDVVANGIDPSRVVLGIVDADGRLEPDVLSYVRWYFRDRRVGGLQLLVRIRNRANWLCRWQDYEFLVFSGITQTAREKLGSVGLGGNGQFTRLSALMELGDKPWTDCLTEDLDLGVRLAIAGWENRFCGESAVDQQGVSSLRQLLRQRTRWAQGHLQCWRLVPAILRSRLPTVTVLDLCYYLLAPAFLYVWSIIFTLMVFLTPLYMAQNPHIWLNINGAVLAVTLWLVSVGPAMFMVGIYRRRGGELSPARALLFAHLLPLYNYIWYVAQWRALYRIVRRRRGWTKTARVREDQPPSSPSAARNIRLAHEVSQ